MSMDAESSGHLELMAVRCRAQTGIVPVRLWALLTPEEKARLGAMTQEAARSKLAGSDPDRASSSADGEITVEITVSSDRVAMADLVGRLPRTGKDSK